MKIGDLVTLDIEKLVFGGQALARTDEGQVVFVWNALPGEKVEARVIKKKRGQVHAIAETIENPSPDRVDHKEEVYLSTSPWQMMSNELEDKAKVEVSTEAYKKLGGFDVPELSIVSDHERAYGYRNKMEFSFYTETMESPIELCFYMRGSRRKVAVDGSLLAEPIINDVACRVRDWLNAEGVNRIDLKTIIVRSNGKGEAIAALFVKKPIEVNAYPELIDGLRGLHLYYSDPKSPASVPTELVYSEGDDSLTASVNGVELQFGLLSFFQVNIPLFETFVNDLDALIDPEKPVIDMYGGVGSIGLSLSGNRDVTIVEENEEAVAFAHANIERNGLSATAICSPSEKVLDAIRGDATLIIDPPRAGLHKKVTQRIAEVKPQQIAYLSCNLSTQARDVELLLEAGYKITQSKLYNFFPRTPHIEGFLLLEAAS